MRNIRCIILILLFCAFGSTTPVHHQDSASSSIKLTMKHKISRLKGSISRATKKHKLVVASLIACVLSIVAIGIRSSQKKAITLSHLDKATEVVKSAAYFIIIDPQTQTLYRIKGNIVSKKTSHDLTQYREFITDPM